MTSGFEIIVRDREYTLETSACVSMFAMPSVVRKAFTDIFSLLSQQGLAPSSPPYIRYFAIDWDEVYRESAFACFFRAFTRKWTMRIGVPVALAAKSVGEVRAGTLPAGRYAQMLHKGSYYKVGTTYKAMIREIKSKGISIKKESIEIYLNDPDITKTKDLETLVLIPLTD